MIRSWWLKHLTLEQGRWPVVIQSQTVETVTDTIDRGPLRGQFLREDGDEVLLLQVGPVVEPGEEVVHLLVVGELGPLVAHPPLQHPRLAGARAGHAVRHAVAHPGHTPGSRLPAVWRRNVIWYDWIMLCWAAAALCEVFTALHLHSQDTGRIMGLLHFTRLLLATFCFELVWHTFSTSEINLQYQF